MLYAADLHIHSVLSPCADLLMGHKNILDVLLKKNIKIFSITDHNAAGNSEIFAQKAKENGLIFVPGIEIQTAEELHMLAYFNSVDVLWKFADIIKKSLPNMKNQEEVFGYQLILDENDDYAEKEEAFLAGASDMGIDEVAKLAKEMGGIIVPAHIDRSNSIISNLGYIPEIEFDAFEVYNKSRVDEFRKKYNLTNVLSSSDSHNLDTLGIIKMEIDITKENAEGVIEAIKSGKVYIK